MTDDSPEHARADAVRDRWSAIDERERNTLVGLAGFGAVLLLLVVFGILNVSYLLFLLGLAGMYMLLTLGLNVQWGYTGLVNFSVIAFWGIGAYSAALLTAERSPLIGEPVPLLRPLIGQPHPLLDPLLVVELEPLHPVWGLLVAVVLSAMLAVLIAVPTLRLRADYLAIATLGFAEIVRMVINNERAYTGGSAGVAGIPSVFQDAPVSQELFEFAAIGVVVVLLYLFLRRIQLSPWGRIQRTIRADEDLAQALGKNTFRFKLQSFVIGSVFMAIAGVVYVHLIISFVSPSGLDPLRTFYVWIGVILGGSGSNRGALVGGFVVVAVREAPSFIKEGLIDVPVVGPIVAGLNVGAVQLFLVGLLVILIVRYRSSGLLPPRREHIWPDAMKDGDGQ